MMGLFGATLLLLLGGTFPVGGLRGGAIGQEPPEHFLFQGRHECHFRNGTQQVRYLERQFWDRQETFRYDSHLGRCVAVTELGKPMAERYNRDQAWLRAVKTNVDGFCRHNYGILHALSSRRTVQPRVKITPTNHFSSSGHNTLLACDVAKFFPSKIEIKWLKNGKELEDPVWTTGLTRNGDWSFQIQAMLETKPERGDVYGCWVDHATFEEPVMVQWEAQSDAARSKLWTGVVGTILGLVFVAAGLTLYLRSKKEHAVAQPSGLMT